MAEIHFYKRKIRYETLVPFGFTKTDNDYTYQTPIAGSQLQLTVTLSDDGKAESTVYDAASGDEFVLHLVPAAEGAFVTAVKEDYRAVLTSIEENCTEPDVFQSEQTKALIEAVRTQYGDELEYLWKKFPDNAVIRRKDNQKWYAAILTVSRRKLGLPSDEVAEIIDLRAEKGEIETLVDNRTYFPGWHMNKKSWYTIILDGSVPTEEIIRRIHESYRLAK